VPVLDHLVFISLGLVPEPVLYPGAGAEDRSQETLLVIMYLFMDKIKNEPTKYKKKPKK
jgi:hypothetical protein